MQQIGFFVIINSAFIFGINALFHSGMILGQIGDRIRKFSKRVSKTEYFPNGWIDKPLVSCPACMASLYGTVGFFFTPIDIYLLPVYIIALAGLNDFLHDLRS